MRVRALLLFAFLVVAILASRGVAAQENHQHALTEEEVGSVRFLTSCSPSVEKRFNRAVALLHSFQYEQVRQAFNDIAKQDPQCAMAQWGIAMSHFHGLWNNSNLAAGRLALQNAQQLANTNKSTRPRERMYIDALAEIYRADDKSDFAHAQAFEQKMGALQEAYPSDDEAALFHALALDISASKTDKTFANQRKCGEILEPIFAKQPHHPGAAHYLIHCYDNPVLAEQGLKAARMYATIAPASAHANHMPSHIFTRVGSWDESIASNLKSKALATTDEAHSVNGARDASARCAGRNGIAQAGQRSDAHRRLRKRRNSSAFRYGVGGLERREPIEGEHCGRSLGAGNHLGGNRRGQRTRRKS